MSEWEDHTLAAELMIEATEEQLAHKRVKLNLKRCSRDTGRLWIA